ncbi:ML domain-containing protein [Chytridium lagenaria]|nr:ML domain-containing protein [Chytridium lagenaria]
MLIINGLAPIFLTVLSITAATSAAPASSSVISNCGLPTDLLTVSSLTVSPDPPKKGQDVTLMAVGDLSEEVTAGAIMRAQVKVGPIKLVDIEMDLCEKLESIGKSCPLPKGETLITQTFSIPKEVPSGRYSVHVDLLTKERKSVGCINANLRL